MRITDNVRTVLSATAGIAGCVVGMTGWAVKAVTPTSASPKTKAAIGVATGVTVGGLTWGALTFLSPAALTLLGVDLSVFVPALGGAGLLSLHTGACTSASYFLGGGLGGGSSSASTEPRTEGRRALSAPAMSQRAKDDAKILNAGPNLFS